MRSVLSYRNLTNFGKVITVIFSSGHRLHRFSLLFLAKTSYKSSETDSDQAVLIPMCPLSIAIKCCEHVLKKWGEGIDALSYFYGSKRVSRFLIPCLVMAKRTTEKQYMEAETKSIKRHPVTLPRFWLLFKLIRILFRWAEKLWRV